MSAAEPGLWGRLDAVTALRFVEESRALLCVITVDGAITWANDAWREVLQWSAADLAGRSLDHLVHRDDAASLRGAMLTVAGTGIPVTMGNRARTAGGGVHWVSWHVARLDDDHLAVSGRSIDEVVRGRVRAVDQSRYLRSVLDAVDAAIAIIDHDGGIVGTYARWCTATQVSGCGVGAPIGTDYLALCRSGLDAGEPGTGWSEEAHLVGEAVADVLSGRRRDAVVEYSHWLPDRQEWFEARVSPLRLGDGRPGCVVTHLETTARVQAEREAQARTVEAEMLSLVARHTNNPVIISDAAGRVRWVNDAFTRLTGLGLDQIRGRTPPGRWDADGAATEPGASTATDALATIRDALAAGSGYEVELRGRSVDGREFWVDIEGRPITDDGVLQGYIEVQNEITTRKRVERRLQEERALLRDIMAAVPFAVFWKDLDSRFLGCNEAMATLAGLARPADIVGLRDDDLPWGAMAAAYQADDREVLSTGEAHLSVQGTLEVADGSLLHILASKVPMRDDVGQVEGLVGVFVDVTEQRAIEAQLANANKLESIGQLAAGVAHEINTPTQYVGDNLHFLGQAMAELIPLLGRARSLARAVETGTAGPDEARSYLDAETDADVAYLVEEVPQAITQSLAGIERVSAIVGAMKEFSHPGVDAMTPIDLNRAVRSSVTVSTNEWKYVAEVVTDLDECLPLVPGIAGELSQVLVNLIVNGAHAIGEAQRDQPGPGTLTISTRRVGDQAEIRVADTGTGIPEEIRDRVFDPFFTTKDVGRGTGQGLSLAHGVVVTKHGGTVSFETETGIGTTFIIRLPLEQGRPPVEELDPPS